VSRKLLDVRFLTFLPVVSGRPLHHSVYFVQVKIEVNIFKFGVILVSGKLSEGRNCVSHPSYLFCNNVFTGFFLTKHVINCSHDRNSWYVGQLFVTIPPNFVHLFSYSAWRRRQMQPPKRCGIFAWVNGQCLKFQSRLWPYLEFRCRRV
jgi:hypothetical protein